MASIEKRVSTRTGKTTYKAVVCVKGYPKESKTFDRKTDAKQWADSREHELKTAPHLHSTESAKRTLKEVIDKYQSDVLPTLKKNSQEGYPVPLAWWEEHYGHLPLRDLTPQLISDARDKIAKLTTRKSVVDPRTHTKSVQVAPVAPSTVVKYLNVLSSALTAAQKQWHWISVNPVHAVSKPKLNNKLNRFLNDEPEKGQQESELARLLRAIAESTSPDLKLAVNIAIHTGCRKQEVMGLTWNDLDLSECAVRFVDNEYRTIKQHGIRGATLPDHVVAELIERKKAQAHLPTDLVFPNRPKPGNPIRPVELKRSWDTAKSRAKIQSFRFHDLRHTAASYLAMRGASLIEIAGLLGHADTQSTERYAHLQPGFVKKINTQITDKINKASQGSRQ